MNKLKATLYSKFGNSINLEEWKSIEQNFKHFLTCWVNSTAMACRVGSAIIHLPHRVGGCHRLTATRLRDTYVTSCVFLGSTTEATRYFGRGCSSAVGFFHLPIKLSFIYGEWYGQLDVSNQVVFLFFFVLHFLWEKSSKFGFGCQLQKLFSSDCFILLTIFDCLIVNLDYFAVWTHVNEMQVAHLSLVVIVIHVILGKVTYYIWVNYDFTAASSNDSINFA